MRNPCPACLELRVMSQPADPGRVPRLGELHRLLPELPELDELFEELVGRSRPDPRARWSGTGELLTVQDRQLVLAELEAAVGQARARLLARAESAFDLSVRVGSALSAGDLDEAVRAMVEVAAAEREGGRTLRAESVIAAAIHLAERGTGLDTRLDTYLAGARIARAIGDWASADTRYRALRALARDGGRPELHATALIGLGNLEVDRGRWEAASARYDEAEEVVRTLPRTRSEHWHLALNRSIVARESERLDRATEHLEVAEAVCPDPNEAGAAAVLLNARGQLLQAQGDPNRAEIAFRKALEAATTPDAKVTIGANLAEVLLARGHTLEAGEVAREAEANAIAGGVLPRLPEVYRTLARVASARQNPDAFVLFEHALGLVDRYELPRFERARTVAEYGRWELGRGESEMGLARLAEAEALFRELGCLREAESLQILMSELDAEASETGRTDDG